MKNQHISRRTLLKGGAAWAGLTVTHLAGPTRLFGQTGGEALPWLDQPPPNPIPNITGNLLKWEALDSRLTPAHNFFFVAHYGVPTGLDEASWRVGVGGLVARPRSLTLEDLKECDPHEVEFTLECSGNTGLVSNTGVEGEFFIGGIGNARWGGARLAPLLERAGIPDGAIEVVFWGVDRGTQTIRDNTGIIRGGQTGTVQPNAAGGLDLTITEQFARSMSVQDALRSDNLLCYQ
jgi:DMSO/TMAO reductase YedYZ molybdopterin-dependent catalytic subunit